MWDQLNIKYGTISSSRKSHGATITALSSGYCAGIVCDAARRTPAPAACAMYYDHLGKTRLEARGLAVVALAQMSMRNAHQCQW